MTRRPAAILAGEFLARILPMPRDERRAVVDEVVGAVIARELAEQAAAIPLPSPPPFELGLVPEIPAGEAAARLLDTERWGECCYGQDCGGDETRPHIHTPPWDGGPTLHVMDRETGREIGR